MCIIFFGFGKSQFAKYKVILAANRDEFYVRPANEAQFLSENPNILCGTDAQPGVEGGTWLGVNKKGKIAFLTNILRPSVEKEGSARGVIVRKFLENNSSPSQYIEQDLVTVDFRSFNFVGIQLKPDDSIECHYYGNKNQKSPKAINEGVHVVACTNITTPWNKVTHGERIFTELLQRKGSEGSDVLAEALFSELLSDSECLFPDELIKTQSASRMSDDFLEKYCSIMISGISTYGTRTQTIVLVDFDNHVTFYERNRTGYDKPWTQGKHEYNIEFSDSV